MILKEQQRLFAQDGAPLLSEDSSIHQLQGSSACFCLCSLYRLLFDCMVTDIAEKDCAFR
jgi:hypothetical protein